MRSSTQLKIVSDNTLIFKPKTGVIYELSGGQGKYTTKVEFKGDVSNCYMFDVGACAFTTVRKDRCHLNDSGIVFLTQESVSLPLGESLVYITNSIGQIAAPDYVKIIMKYGVIVDVNINVPKLSPLRLVSENSTLRQELKQQLGSRIDAVEVKVGVYPIQLENKPSLAALKDVFYQFTQHNTCEKLASQFKDTFGRCYIRAHFSSIYLKQHGISSCKIYKRWTQQDWIKFNLRNNKPTNDCYWYHTAALIVDQDNNKWVWDPWENPNNPLASLEQWLFQEAQPTPAGVLISSMYVMYVTTNGHCATATSFKALNEEDTNYLQYVYRSAVPNRPSLNRFGLFERGVSEMVGRVHKNMDLVRSRDMMDDDDNRHQKRFRL